jgi:hypothetical protein
MPLGPPRLTRTLVSAVQVGSAAASADGDPDWSVRVTVGSSGAVAESNEANTNVVTAIG